MPDADEKEQKRLRSRRRNGHGAIALSIMFFSIAAMNPTEDIAEKIGGFLVPVFFLALGIYLLNTKPKGYKPKE